ncbi:hypothetical protein [Methanobacterium spitsbergense]|uniref:Uncharacterized protein n=1 Tax=Methanobacterium spitsbergense TaxID=2874285 RepID=A0A8T5USF6_9EURY|nr:hypothetical protein [Methanobacterium spitsbergense]MBZ2164906.1 hypothetical protein [Methanobacterium spitsbergense]
MIKYGVLAGGLIAIFIVAFYVFGYEPTSLELTKSENLFDKNITKLNQTGKTDPNAIVTINGEKVPVDKNGNFYWVIDLKNGKNIINVTAKAPFKSKNQTYAIVNRAEDKDGVTGDWDWNNTYET